MALDWWSKYFASKENQCPDTKHGTDCEGKGHFLPHNSVRNFQNLGSVQIVENVQKYRMYKKDETYKNKNKNFLVYVQ